MSADESVSGLQGGDAPASRISELQARLAAAEQAVQARDDFLAIASHELRSPMNALALQLAAIERLARNDGESRLAGELQRARRILGRYVKRATTLLEVTRLNAGRLPIRREVVDLRALVADTLEAHAEEAGFHKVTVTARVEEGIVGCWDVQAVEEIFSNLLTNAFKYGQGGLVAIRGWSDTGTHACISVTDQGPGIDEGSRQRIFQKFEQVVEGPKSQGGFGVGLWIVGRLVHAHGGRVEVEAQPGRGSCFTVRLPLLAACTDSTFEAAT